MVMETPSALWIGREFVRQYYTVLNQAPIYLHRFYSQDSSFVHGGPEKQVSVTGQQGIHERIMQLNFRDCHARIRQVDSQSTLGQGVVVQVTGELSNAGQPMRRFMQTFVLAHQTPLKYYVRNDIFRYQDEVFTEEEEEDSDKAVREEDQADTQASDTSSGPGIVATTSEDAAVAGGDLTNCATSPATPTARGPYYEPQEVVRNGTAHLVSESESSPQGTGTSSSLQSSPPEVGVTSTSSGSTSMVWKEEESPPPASTAASTAVNTSQVNHQAPVETKTYANMVSKNSTPLSSASFTCLSPAPFGGAAPTSHTPTSTTAPPTSRFGGESLGTGLPPRGGDQRGPRPQGRPPRSMPPGGPPPRRSEGPPAPRGEGSPLGGVDEGGQVLGGPRPGPKTQYPDTQQVFVGNLPHSVTEEQVRERFEQFGHVIDFRINAKPSTKMTAAGKTVPNCGFVVFDSPEAVQAVLKSTPIHINETRVNVEEKKTKQKLATEGRGGGPPFSSGGGAPRGGGMMQRGGARGNGRGGAFPRGNRNPPGLGTRH